MVFPLSEFTPRSEVMRESINLAGISLALFSRRQTKKYRWNRFLDEFSTSLSKESTTTMDDSSSSEELSLRIADTMEFTLEDTLGLLKELKIERDNELEHMYEEQINNQGFAPLNKTVNLSDKQQQFTLSLINEISNIKMEDFPIPNTVDMIANMVTGLANDIENLQAEVETATENLRRKQDDIIRLQKESTGMEKMRQSCLAANEIIASKTYEQEIRITTEIFKDVRENTKDVVAELFKEADHVRDFLATLSSAYFTSGEDVYVDLLPEVTDAANFLLEANLIVYHPYDVNKVRFVDL